MQTTGINLPDTIEKLQRKQSQSADWAMKYEGWRIVGVDNKGNEHKTN